MGSEGVEASTLCASFKVAGTQTLERGLGVQGTIGDQVFKGVGLEKWL